MACEENAQLPVPIAVATVLDENGNTVSIADGRNAVGNPVMPTSVATPVQAVLTSVATPVQAVPIVATPVQAVPIVATPVQAVPAGGVQVLAGGNAVPDSSNWSKLCGPACCENKACEKSPCQCFWSHTCCYCFLIPNAHQLVSGNSAVAGSPCCKYFPVVCCALTEFPDFILSYVPYVGVLFDLFHPVQAAATHALRRELIQKYGIIENDAMSWIMSCWIPQLCCCAACQQSNEILVRENLELAGDCWCATSVVRRAQAQSQTRSAPNGV